jgi:hypothetical protein
MRHKGPARDLGKEREWRERVRRREQSGDSVRTFCRRKGVRESAFYAWRGELARRREERHAAKEQGMSANPAGAVRFVPLQVTAGKDADDPPGVEILLSRARMVRVRPGFDRQTLLDVLAVLEASPC